MSETLVPRLAIEAFSEIEDPRVVGRSLHDLVDILMITVCGVIGGAEGWEQIELFAQERQSWLKRFLKLRNGIPSHDTLRRVFARLEPAVLQRSFLSWIQGVYTVTEGQVIAVDGKTLRQSYRKGERHSQGALHMIEAWAVESGLVLGQHKSEGKSNEIESIPELLELLSLKGCIVTLDAMGCQKKIAAQIRDQQGDYVLALKGNHGDLYDDVVAYFRYAERCAAESLKTHTRVEKGHGRVETRQYQVCGELAWLEARSAWRDLNCLVKVESQRWIDGETSTEQRYYLSSLPWQAEINARAVRSHWAVENSLHYVLDVSFREDDSRIREGHGAENMAVVRRIAINALKQESTTMSIKKKRFKASMNTQFLEQVVTNALLVR